MNDFMTLLSEGMGFNPSRAHLFSNLGSLGVQDIRVCIAGQDPYPQHRYATGHAFSIPEHFGPADYPPTLKEILAEYGRDLGYPVPLNGNLRRWVDERSLIVERYP